VIEEEGKTDESFTAENGKEYVTPDAPAVFRCLGVAKLKRVDARSGLYGVIDCRNLSF
jgi:hypothetical protein